MDITKKEKEKVREPETPSMATSGNPPVRGGRKQVTITIRKKQTLNLRRAGLNTVFGKEMHDWRDGPLTGWASQDEMLKIKTLAATELIAYVIEDQPKK